MAITPLNYREQYARYSRYWTEIKKIYSQAQEVREGIELTLTLLAISFFIVFAIRPTATTIADLWSSIRSQEEIATKLDEKLTNLASARALFEQEQSRISLLEGAIAKSPEPARWLRQLEGQSAATGVSLTSLTLDKAQIIGKPVKEESETKEEKVAGAKGVNITFSVSGSFENVFNFLSSLEKMRQITYLQTILLGFATGASETKTIVLNASAFFPYQDQESKQSLSTNKQSLSGE